MPDYRRYRVPGGTYFFTVNLLERRLNTLVRYVDVLREEVRVTRRERPSTSTRGWFCPITCIVSRLYRQAMIIFPTDGKPSRFDSFSVESSTNYR